MSADKLPKLLGEYASDGFARFHSPGHKGVGLNGFWRQELEAWDIDGNAPNGGAALSRALKRAERDMADAYGEGMCRFLTGGISAGLAAMVMLASRRGGVLLDRSCGEGAINGAMLCGATSCGTEIYCIAPQFDIENGRYGVITPDALDAALCASGAKSALISSPSPYGRCADVPALAEVCEKHGAWLMMDFSGGAHLAFSDALPQTPAGYADIWCTDASRTLNALCPGALLFAGRRLAQEDGNRLEALLSALTADSRSSLVAASLDWARYTATLNGAWDKHVTRVNELAAKLGRLPGISAFAAEDAATLVIDVRERGITGFAARRALKRGKIAPQLADDVSVVLLTSPADPDEWYERLHKVASLLPYSPTQVCPCPPPPLPDAVRLTTLAQALDGQTERVKPEYCADRICMERVALDTPATALLLPGERISGGLAEYIFERLSAGAKMISRDYKTIAVLKS